MLRKYKHPTSGAELQLGDVDLISQNAAEAEDYISKSSFASLLAALPQRAGS